MDAPADQHVNPSKAERTYSIALGVLTGFNIFGIISLNAVMNRHGMDDSGRAGLSLARNMDVCFIVLSIAAILVRFAPAAPRKWFSTVLNILLLLIFPFGTAIGIYGLRKLDKADDPSPAS
jgi:hypothetical protein